MAVLAVLQLLVVASDIADAAPWAALGSLDAALSTGAGIALAARVLLAVVLWALLFRTPTVDEEVRRSAIALSAFAILGTWAWAGHSSTQRWAELGMPVDIAHHAAAALWIAGLLVVGVVRHPAAQRPAPGNGRRAALTAAGVAVAVIVLTGIVQSLRLVGSPGDLFAADHGKYLARQARRRRRHARRRRAQPSLGPQRPAALRRRRRQRRRHRGACAARSSSSSPSA